MEKLARLESRRDDQPLAVDAVALRRSQHVTVVLTAAAGNLGVAVKPQRRAFDIVAQQSRRGLIGIDLCRDRIDQRTAGIDAHLAFELVSVEIYNRQRMLAPYLVFAPYGMQRPTAVGILHARHSEKSAVDTRRRQQLFQIADRFQTRAVCQHGILFGHHLRHAAQRYVDLVLQQCRAGAAAAQTRRAFVDHAAVDAVTQHLVRNQCARNAGSDDHYVDR